MIDQSSLGYSTVPPFVSTSALNIALTKVVGLADRYELGLPDLNLENHLWHL